MVLFWEKDPFMCELTSVALLLALSFVVEPGGTSFDEVLADIRSARASGEWDFSRAGVHAE